MLAIGDSCDNRLVKVIQRWVPKAPYTPQEPHMVEQPLTTPVVDTPKDSSNNELGWVAATKVASMPIPSSATQVQRSSFSLFQKVRQEEEGILSILRE